MRPLLNRVVDYSALRVHYAFVIALLAIAFILESLPLVSFVATLMLIGALMPDIAFFRMFYLLLLKPVGWVKPDLRHDNPEPHRFAQALAAVLMVAALALLGNGLALFGWALVLGVVLMAAVHLSLGVCIGSWVYYRLYRLGVPGFNRAPISRI